MSEFKITDYSTYPIMDKRHFIGVGIKKKDLPEDFEKVEVGNEDITVGNRIYDVRLIRKVLMIMKILGHKFEGAYIAENLDVPMVMISVVNRGSRHDEYYWFIAPKMVMGE